MNWNPTIEPQCPEAGSLETIETKFVPREVNLHEAVTSDYTNIDLFRIYAGTTFAFLYELFPLGKRLEAGQLVEQCNLATDHTSRAEYELIVHATWRWLKETDYLRYDPNADA
jgi:hypothetical protein